MADSTAAFADANPPPQSISFADPLQTPPLDPLFFSSDPDNDFINDLAFHFDLHDLDPQYFIPDTDDSFFLPDSTTDHADLGSALPEHDGSLQDFCFDHGNNNRVDVESENSVISRDGCSDAGKYFNSSPSQTRSFDSHETIIASAPAPAALAIVNSAAASPVSSHGSGDEASGVSETMNVPSPDSKSYPLSSTKLENEEANEKSGGLPKRKKEFSDDTIEETTRRQKCKVSETPSNSNPKDATTGCGGEEDEKKKARLMRNRESAQLSRQRKKHYVDELEEKVRAMNSIIADLNGRVSYFMAENATLRQQLVGGTPMYQHPPMHYPWMPPGAPYLVQGSKVPLVPIPRLKPQQPAASTKSKKGETKKSGTRTKKVASVSFIGLLCFILMFSGLVPLINVKYGGPGENVAEGNKFSGQHFPGRVLVVDGHSNISSGKTGVGFSGDTIGKMQCQKAKNGCDNSSEQLHASLYVPRNNKLVKIDGNLIIQSVLASERTKGEASEATGLAIANHLSSGALAIPEGTIRGKTYHSHAEQQKAIGSTSADKLEEQFKSSAADGKLQQWFHHGLAGPILSSGVCSEVFQFDTTPSRGAIVAASSVTNLTREGQQQRANPTEKKKHRRILHALPVPFPASNLNVTREHRGSNNRTTYDVQRSSSSMVVSVLVDPREVGDSEVDGVIVQKSLSRVFVVVLVDGVKYVTYSCVLPRSTPHLVRA